MATRGAKQTETTVPESTEERPEVVAEVMRQTSTAIPSNVYREIETWDDAMRAVVGYVDSIEDASREIGDGFSVLPTDRKHILIGVPLMFTEWNFYQGENGEFVAARAIAQQDGGGIRKLVINDGSTGICEQLREYSKRTGRYGGLLVRHGLRKSEYDVEIEDRRTGEKSMKHAVTYYLDTSA